MRRRSCVDCVNSAINCLTSSKAGRLGLASLAVLAALGSGHLAEADPIDNPASQTSNWTDIVYGSNESSQSNEASSSESDVKIGRPQWHSEEPFRVNDLFIGMSVDELEKALGKPKRGTDDSGDVYTDDVLIRDNVLIRMSNGRVVNICVAWDDKDSDESLQGDVAGASPSEYGDKSKEKLWFLGQGKANFLALGAPEQASIEALGDPLALYVHKKHEMRIAVYSQAKCDVGVLILDKRIHGFMLTEPGLLAEGLRWSGYTPETGDNGGH